MGYDNSQYWEGLHKKYGARLATVGYPSLSEAFNALKYESEAETVLGVLREVGAALAGRGALRVLDVGAGIGYWSCLVEEFFRSQGREVRLTALDISEQALGCVREKLPAAELVRQDLKAVEPGLLEGRFDLVYSFYCLHHLPRLSDFANGARFAARSVAPGGFLVVMDPVLTMPYSQLDSFDFASYASNGCARHLYVLDDILQQEGCARLSVRPAVSFVLNSSIEARARWSFTWCDRLWRMLQFFYRSERRTAWVRRAVRRLDRWCKGRNRAYSSSVCVYRRQAASQKEAA